MGNCCGGADSGEEQARLRSNNQGNNSNVKLFQGEGHRLGTAGELPQNQQPTTASMERDEIPEPKIDENLTEEERAKIRADRAAAAEARLKKNQIGKPIKKKETSNAPLKGPNSEPLMRWTAS